jgi:hypothetical protein
VAIFALNPGGSWVDGKLSLEADPLIDRVLCRGSGRWHAILPLLAPFYEAHKLWRMSSGDRAFSRQLIFLAAGLWVGFESVYLAGLWGISCGSGRVAVDRAAYFSWARLSVFNSTVLERPLTRETGGSPSDC